jgi:hypothetical protein
MVRSEQKVSAKKRSKAVVSTKAKSKEAVTSHRRFDVAGIMFLAMAALCVVALATRNSGVVGTTSERVRGLFLLPLPQLV